MCRCRDMQCPWCNHSYRLTWTMYFRSPLARFICPTCGKRFRLECSLAYLRMLTVAAMDPCYSCTERVQVVRKRLGNKKETINQRELLQMSWDKTERVRRNM